MQVRHPTRRDFHDIHGWIFFIVRIRTDSRGVPREARCECNDQVEMCG